MDDSVPLLGSGGNGLPNSGVGVPGPSGLSNSGNNSIVIVPATTSAQIPIPSRSSSSTPPPPQVVQQPSPPLQFSIESIVGGSQGPPSTLPRGLASSGLPPPLPPPTHHNHPHHHLSHHSSITGSISPSSNEIIFIELPPINTTSDSTSKRYLYNSQKHSNLLLDSLSILRKRRELCDIVLIVGNRKIYAHRVLLAAYSPYFLAMFTGELVESRQTEVHIRDIDEQAMELLIDFAYTSKIVIEESNVQVLLPAACLLQMTEIQEVCCEFLKQHLNPSNCLGIRSFADLHSCQDLLVYSDQYTLEHFPEVIENEEFLLLPANQLIDIISSDELNIASEEQVYQAIMQWVKANVQERRQHLSHVLQHVRLSQLTAKFLVGTVSSDILIKNDEPCRDLVDEAKNYLLLPQERSLMVGPRFRPRKPVRRGEVLFAAGGWCSGDAIASVERYDPETNEWRMVAPMTKRRCGVGCSVLGDMLYAVGGHDGQSYLNSIERYDPHMNQWCTDVAPTSTSRTSVGVGVLDGFLYAVGGQDGVSCLNIVERYDPQTNRWTKLANMNSKRLGVAVAVLGGYLYAVGGSDGTSPLSSVERYDPRTNRWNPVAPMWTRRKHLGCAVFNNMIYAVGGRDDSTELNTAERYNPTTNTWQPIVAMTSRRSGVGLAVVNGMLFAVGGFDGQTYLKTLEMYDSECNQWRLCGSMNYRRLGGGVGVIRMFESAKTPIPTNLLNDLKLNDTPNVLSSSINSASNASPNNVSQQQQQLSSVNSYFRTYTG